MHCWQMQLEAAQQKKAASPSQETTKAAGPTHSSRIETDLPKTSEQMSVAPPITTEPEITSTSSLNATATKEQAGAKIGESASAKAPQQLPAAETWLAAPPVWQLRCSELEEQVAILQQKLQVCSTSAALCLLF